MFGTDLGVYPYGSSGKQFAFMVKYGMTPMQTIQSATTNAADLLGRGYGMIFIQTNDNTVVSGFIE